MSRSSLPAGKTEFESDLGNPLQNGNRTWRCRSPGCGCTVEIKITGDVYELVGGEGFQHDDVPTRQGLTVPDRERGFEMASRLGR